MICGLHMYIFVVYIQQCLDYSFKMTHMYRLLDGWLFISIFACIYTTLVYQRYVQLHEGVSVSFGQVRSDSWICGRGKLIRGWGGQIKKESKKIGRTERKIQKKANRKPKQRWTRKEFLCKLYRDYRSRPDRSEPNWMGDAGYYGGVGNARALNLLIYRFLRYPPGDR